VVKSYFYSAPSFFPANSSFLVVKSCEIRPFSPKPGDWSKNPFEVTTARYDDDCLFFLFNTYDSHHIIHHIIHDFPVKKQMNKNP